MEEILRAYPSAKVGLFHRYHIGGRESCHLQAKGDAGGSASELLGTPGSGTRPFRCRLRVEGVARMMHGSHGSLERTPGALFRAIGALFLLKNPDRSREALARELQDNLETVGVEYHVRTLRGSKIPHLSSEQALW